jgi:hypothetical protein
MTCYDGFMSRQTPDEGDPPVTDAPDGAEYTRETGSGRQGGRPDSDRHVPIIGSAESVTGDERIILAMVIAAVAIVGLLLLSTSWRLGRYLGIGLIVSATLAWFGAHYLARRRDRRIASGEARAYARVSTDEMLVFSVYALYYVIAFWMRARSGFLPLRLAGAAGLSLIAIVLTVALVRWIRRRRSGGG